MFAVQDTIFKVGKMPGKKKNQNKWRCNFKICELWFTYYILYGYVKKQTKEILFIINLFLLLLYSKKVFHNLINYSFVCIS